MNGKVRYGQEARHLSMARTVKAVSTVAVLLCCSAQSLGQAAKMVVAPNGRTVTYRIPMLQDERAVTDPISSWSYYFNVPPGVVLAEGSTVELVYSFSSTILKGQSSITVSLNGKPLSTRRLAFNNGAIETWEVSLPRNLLKVGFNEVKIDNRQRSIEGPCQDVDNAGNWIRFKPTSTLNLVRERRDRYPLLSYPFPYLDQFAPNPAAAAWILPETPEPEDITEALNLASSFGRNLPASPMRFVLSKGRAQQGKNYFIGIPGSGALAAVEPEPQEDPNAGAIAALERTAQRWRDALKNARTAQAKAMAAEKIAETESLMADLIGQPQPEPDKPAVASVGKGVARAFTDNGEPQIEIVGEDRESLTAIRQALSRPDLVEQMEGYTAGVDTPLGEPDLPGPQARMGEFRLSELGHEPLVMSGAFHQRATVTVMRPLRADIGRESSIRVRFRHSASLNPLRSLLTLYANGIPIGSSQLNPANANGGVLEAYLPVDLLAQNRWILEFAVYHDLGSIDCSKSYDDVAWTVIEADTSIDLKPGLLLGRPYLENFPYVIPRTGVVPPETTMYLPEEPSNAKLSLAATMASRAAQTNGATIRWLTRVGAIEPSTTSSAVIIGTYNEIGRFATLADKLLAAPTANGLKIDPKLQVIPSALRNGVIVQAIKNPWNTEGVLYVILAENDQALGRFHNYLATRKALDEIRGQAVLFTAEGRLVSLGVSSEADLPERTQESDRYTTVMRIIMFIILALLAAGAVWLALQFVKRKRAGEEEDEEDEDYDEEEEELDEEEEEEE